MLASLVPSGPIRDDPELDLIAQRGEQHERVYIGRLKGVVAAQSSDLSAERPTQSTAGTSIGQQAVVTRTAIERGDDVIFQACFFDGIWLGFADFLLRMDDPVRRWVGPMRSRTPSWPTGSRLRAAPEPCVYNEMLAAIQGVYPDRMYVALGGKDKKTAGLPTADFSGLLPRLPGPASSRPLAPRCRPTTLPRRRHIQSRTSTAGSAAGMRSAASDAGRMTTCVGGQYHRAHTDRAGGPRHRRRGASLGALELPLTPRLEGTRPEVLERVHEQARSRCKARTRVATSTSCWSPSHAGRRARHDQGAAGAAGAQPR